MKIELFWDFREAAGTDGRLVSLDMTEAKVLREILAMSPGVAKTEDIAKKIFGSKRKTNCVGVYVMRLRDKLGRDAIGTIVNIGYRIK